MRSELVAIACFSAAVAAHGKVTSPPARVAGPAMAAACGDGAITALKEDDTIPLEDIPNPPASCNLFLCRGATFEDNKNQVQSFSPGQTVNFKAELPIPHEGPCNVSVVDTASNKIIGDPLITFDSYADEKLAQLPANNTNFDVKVPQMASGQCTKPGECVMQWFWFGTNAKQTYESCVDFVMQSSTSKSQSQVKSSQTTQSPQ